MHINIYGEHSMTNNIHLLNHIVDDVEFLGDLTTISAYQFENALHHIKIRLKQCNRPLEQIGRRLQEVAQCSKNLSSNFINDVFPKVSHQLLSPDRFGNPSFHRIEYEQNVFISSANGNLRDRWFLTNENHIVEFDLAIKTRNGFMIRGSRLQNQEDFFEKPFRSRYINIFLSDGCKHEPSLYHVNTIKAKLFCIRYKEKSVFVPLLHTLSNY